ncbi:MAG TPA: hypothetical protein VFG72_15620 [Marmoricola sp.]|nr:hypothetical protein [Marmoricola sp.]
MNNPTRLAALALTCGAVAVPTAVFASAETVPTADGTITARHQADNLEKGIVVECTSADPALEAWVSMYENSRYGNVLQVVVGDPDQGMGASTESDRRFVRARKAFGQVEVGGEVATLRGKVVRRGERTRVREVIDDAGEHIVTRGWNRPLRTRLTLRYGDVKVPLDCDTAFAYHLHVTKTPTAG